MHDEFIVTLASEGNSPDSVMKALVEDWKKIQELKSLMERIATTSLKEHDIFGPCRFCRKL